MVAQLPIELLQIIFQDATQESLRQFRLVDRQWNAASTPCVFERFHASLFSRSLTKLSALSQSPLAKYVKAIDFHIDQLPGHYSREEWEAKIDFRPDFLGYRASLEDNEDYAQVSSKYDKLPRHTFTPAHLDQGWNAFRKYCGEQEHWSQGQEGAVLKDCVSRLHNVREVVVDRAKPFAGLVNIQPFWRTFRTEILVGPDAWTYESSRWDGLDSLASLFMVTAIGHRNSVPGTRAVEKLTLNLPAEWSFYDMVYLPSHYPNRDSIKGYPESADPAARYEVILSAFRTLKHLTLRCPSADDGEDLEGISQVQEATLILNTASGLRSLDLDFGEPGDSYEGVEDHIHPGLVPLLAHNETAYPHLENLRISASFDSKLFESFLLLHKKTLKSLDIRDCFCDDWEKVLLTIAKTLDLEHIYLESLWSPGPVEDDWDEGGEGPALLLGEGLDAIDEFAQDLKVFLYTGKGSMPREDDYEASEDSDPLADEREETFYQMIAVSDPDVVSDDGEDIEEE
jgi:hypothetical protein